MESSSSTGRGRNGLRVASRSSSIRGNLGGAQAAECAWRAHLAAALPMMGSRNPRMSSDQYKAASAFRWSVGVVTDWERPDLEPERSVGARLSRAKCVAGRESPAASDVLVYAVSRESLAQSDPQAYECAGRRQIPAGKQPGDSNGPSPRNRTGRDVEKLDFRRDDDIDLT